MSKYQFIFEETKKSSKKLLSFSDAIFQKVLNELADLTLEQSEFLVAENRRDLDRMSLDNPMRDRLELNSDRISGICEELRNVAALPSPLNKVLEEKTLENGLVIKKESVPLGVLGIIYESRPNVTFDVFALALKSGNGLLLKGGSDAEFSNIAIMLLIHRVLERNGIPREAFQLLPAEREATKELLEAFGYVDVIIPRGSQNLISFVRDKAKVPVIETGAGIVHTFLDHQADLEKAKAIILNAKTRRPSVCNSLDCLIVHESQLTNLNEILEPLIKNGVQVYADKDSFEALGSHPSISRARVEHFGTEFLSLKLSIKTVKDLDEGLDHIEHFSSKHSEAIISTNEHSINRFLQEVDAAAVYVNASTAFTDGAQFGLGAEIGISTQKLHARGPMALNELTTYKWKVIGEGQIRP
ncbi:glutamate-5-semialdehyde dehydrogenase [Algoriphagus sediminis]|uniref:Gamma-glutamyl phosphate reductase n=1 Tax=Algoriphagus sediminis TaxID=3057113 RepID=A0ABT7Y8V3_9BACT|nr:glutamate-5-semialdehyde dehydrogenase [Algoriphagus sediminis]MDN3202918.1 glutamate-5-semialdehyde dehydrogenase [Algoriphagus sediminis]